MVELHVFLKQGLVPGLLLCLDGQLAQHPAHLLLILAPFLLCSLGSIAGIEFSPAGLLLGQSLLALLLPFSLLQLLRIRSKCHSHAVFGDVHAQAVQERLAGKAV